MAKIRDIIYPDGSLHHAYKCPGCGYEHVFSPSVHQYNGDRERPTISPSLLLNNPQNYHTCHSFIKNGYIQFLDDCWHLLKGQTVILEEYSETQVLVEDTREG